MSNEKQKTMLNNPKLRLSAPCPTAKGKYSNLSWDIWNSNPRIVVATNDPSLTNPDNQYGRITAAMDAPTMMAFLEILKDVALSDKADKVKIENYGNQKGGDPKSPVHLTDLWVGKDDSGLVFISVVNKADGWPVIKFVFGPTDSRYHKVFHGDGSEFTKAEISKAYAMGYAKMLASVYNQLFVRDYVHQVNTYGKKPYTPPAQAAQADSGSGDIPW